MYFNVFSPKHKVASKVLLNSLESIQSELPHYQFDIERKQITEKPQLKSICGTQPKYLRENGLLCDEYTDECLEVEMSDLEVFDNKDYHDNYETLRDAFPNVTIIRDKEFGKLEREVLEEKLLNTEYLNCSLMVPFQMPDKFEYTGAIMINNLFEGWLHTFVRNWEKWSQLIKGLKETIDILWPIQPFLKKIQEAENFESSGNALNELSDKLSNLDPLTFIDVKLALLQAQLQLHKYLEQTINSKECTPTYKKGNFMEHFELPDKRVINICTSKQPYPDVLDFGCQVIEGRPIRVIRTVAFNDAPIDQIQEETSPLNYVEIKNDDPQREHENKNKLDNLINLRAQTGIDGDYYEKDYLDLFITQHEFEMQKHSLIDDCDKEKISKGGDSKENLSNQKSKNEILQHQEKLKSHYERMVEKCSEKERESGLHADRYAVDVYTSSFGLLQKEKHRESLDTGEKSLSEAWPDTAISTDSNYSENHNFASWLHLRLPDPVLVNGTIISGFSYTGAIMTDNLYEGLFHTFVRHWDVWLKLIPNFTDIEKELEPIESHLENIRKAKNLYHCNAALEKLIVELKSMNEDIFKDVYNALSKAQMAVYDFIRNKVKSENYLVEGVNIKDKILTNFEINDTDDRPLVMVLSMSTNLYRTYDEFSDDKRPIREITTVYFITKPDFERQTYYLHDDCDESDDDITQKLANRKDVRTTAWNNHKNFTDATVPPHLEDKVRELSEEEIQAIIGEDKSPEQCEKQENGINSQNWLHVRMPSEFGYTCAIITNNLGDGLFHTFCRHWTDFVDSIPILETLMNGALSPIKEKINAVRDLENEAVTALLYALNNCEGDLRTPLYVAQIALFKHIKNNVTYEKYYGEGVNLRCQIQVYFRKYPTDCIDIRNDNCNNGIRSYPENYLPSMAVCVKPGRYSSNVYSMVNNTEQLLFSSDHFKTIKTCFCNHDFYKFYIDKAWHRKSHKSTLVSSFIVCIVALAITYFCL